MSEMLRRVRFQAVVVGLTKWFPEGVGIWDATEDRGSRFADTVQTLGPGTRPRAFGDHFARARRRPEPRRRDNMSGNAANVIQVSTNLSLTNANNSATVGSAVGLFVGMYIGHPKVPFGTTILAISGSTITMSVNATATVSSTGRFSPIKDTQTLGQVGGELGHVNATTEMASHTHANSLNETPHTHGVTPLLGSTVLTTAGGSEGYAGGAGSHSGISSGFSIDSASVTEKLASQTVIWPRWIPSSRRPKFAPN